MKYMKHLKVKKNNFKSKTIIKIFNILQYNIKNKKRKEEIFKRHEE